MGLKYLRYVGDSTKTIGELSGVSAHHHFDLGLTSSNMQVSYLFDLPFTVHPGGLLIDMAGLMLSTIKLDTTAATTGAVLSEAWPTFKMATYASSAYEHYIWQENAHVDAVSTVRGLQFAKETGVPVITLNASNIASYDTLMDASMGSCKKQISDYIAAGATITVPTKTISYIAPGQSKSEWSGADYMVENAGQGFAGAIITPAHGGGYALTEKEPESEFYEEEAAVPSEQEPASGSSAPVNSTSAANGENPLSTVPSGDPVNMLTGNMYHAERDLSIKGRGLPIVFERYYNSRNPQDGPLGFGWTHSFNHFLTFYGVEGGVAKVSWTDGTGAAARFRTPYGIAVDSSGNVFVSDQYNNRIEELSPDGNGGYTQSTIGSGFSPRRCRHRRRD